MANKSKQSATKNHSQKTRQPKVIFNALDTLFSVDNCIDPLRPDHLLGHINMTLDRLAKPEDSEDYRKAKADAFGGGWERISEWLNNYRDPFLSTAQKAGFPLDAAIEKYDAVAESFDLAKMLAPLFDGSGSNKSIDLFTSLKSKFGNSFHTLEKYMKVIREKESKKGKPGAKVTDFNKRIGPGSEKSLPLGTRLDKRHEHAKREFGYADDCEQFTEDWSNYLDNHSKKNRTHN